MTDPAIGRKYAEECPRPATTTLESDRRPGLEHAGLWLWLAQELNVKQPQKLSHQ
jgi:hypothetical protein